MIEKRTVFILGAGASCPYGFPTAKALRSKIIGEFVSAYESLLKERQKSGINGINEGYPSAADATRFANCFDVSSTESIDLFLSRHPQFKTIGKIAIALTILKAEQTSQFREGAKVDEDWYFLLFNRLTRELAGRDGYQEFSKNNVAFVTFNYDRSLEYFLFNSLLHAFEGADPARVQEQILGLAIVHVYGQIAPVKLYDNSQEQLPIYSLAYGRDIAHLSVVDFLSDMRYLYVVREDRANAQLEKARMAISEAERIFFLGFAYAKENLEAIGLPDVLKRHHRVYGTARGWITTEINRVRSGFLLTLQRLAEAAGSSLDGSETVEIRNCDCVQLLRDFL
jgi:hypothetical protein